MTAYFDGILIAFLLSNADNRVRVNMWAENPTRNIIQIRCTQLRRKRKQWKMLKCLML